MSEETTEPIEDSEAGYAEEDSSEEPRPGFPKELLITLAGCVALMVGVTYFVRRGETPEPPKASEKAPGELFVGDRACRECHPGETAAFSRSGHSHTLRKAATLDVARWLDGRFARDPENTEVLWNYRLAREGENAEPRLSASRPAVNAEERKFLEYAFGSGKHAITFVTVTDHTPAQPQGYEHRLTYYAQKETLGITPGQDKGSSVEPETIMSSGRVLKTERFMKCFDCHSTILSKNGQSEFVASEMIPNLTCERCHGPAADHVRDARAGKTDLRMPFGAGRQTAIQQMRLCGHCHRLPEMAPPGEIRPDNTELARFQPVGLMQTKCFNRSKGELTCVTCHDPHSRTKTDRSHYVNACLGCHSGAGKTPCKVSPKEGCIDCHMPTRDSGQNILFHDHWIRVFSEAKLDRTSTSKSGE